MTAQDKQTTKEVKAYARYIHVSPRKLRLVADLIDRNSVDEALMQLKFSHKKAALPIMKALNSAVANAVHNFDLNKEQLYIKKLTIDPGPVIKKAAPRAQGRAFLVRKRTSHINVLLEFKPAGRKSKRSIFRALPKVIDKPEAKQVTKQESQAVDKVERTVPKIKQPPKSEEKIKRHLVDLKRRLFNRKSGT
ncbi:MAG: 50S ribosomal protein L22 [Candidatus Doudnabacteria bacterium]|nr:50S ribosomal protein L22 [Candidatus Doudnabacteria bacterium]